jgi:UDP-N-acetylglucosamine 2-epimerase
MVYFIIGTRPELIKIAPVVMEMKKRKFSSFKIINTAQHKEILEPYWEIFNNTADETLDLILPGQDLVSLNNRALLQIDELLKKTDRPQLIIAQGDTTTVYAASVVAFYHRVPFYHLEAGLRSGNLYSPFPEEFNRRCASIAAGFHYAPTQLAKENLLKENISEDKIAVVGNTVVDALEYIRSSPLFEGLNISDKRIRSLLADNKKIVLVTCHRRENHGENLMELIEAIGFLAKKHEDLNFVWPVHPNPNILEHVKSSGLKEMENICLTNPLSYLELIKVLSVAEKVMTDSGGIQEEAPSFGKAVLVLRTETERPEAINAGFSCLVGCNKAKIIEQFESFVPSPGFYNPFGDGKAAFRIVDHILNVSKSK